MKNTAWNVVLLFFVITSGLGLWLSALAFAFTLPDTGQTKCYNTSGAEIACAGTGQDGAYNINPISYTDNGNGTVMDNVTGLMWQQDENTLGYNWYQASGTYDAYWNSSSKNTCGSLTLAGLSDWRLPTKNELITLVDYSTLTPEPAINTTYFPDTRAYDYWSSTTYAGYTNNAGAWPVGFGDGSASFMHKGAPYGIRCVRGGQSSLSPSLTDNGNGTVTDSATGLIWQQEEPGTMTWSNALSYCEGLSLGDATDWRLPNIKELGSIIDYSKYNPAVDTVYFPNINKIVPYWSSTTYAGYTNDAWDMHFKEGYASVTNKVSKLICRCVRGGQSESYGGTENNCAASVSSSLVVHIPILTYSGSNYWADLQYNSSNSRLTVAGAGAVSDVSPYSSCNASTLSSGGILHIPVLIISGVSYWLDLQYNDSVFAITGAGQN